MFVSSSGISLAIDITYGRSICLTVHPGVEMEITLLIPPGITLAPLSGVNER